MSLSIFKRTEKLITDARDPPVPATTLTEPGGEIESKLHPIIAWFTFFYIQIKNFLWDLKVFQILLVGSTVKALTREFSILERKLKDVQEVIERDVASKNQPTEEVEGWMVRVEALQPRVESVVTAYDNQTYLRSIYSISIRAVNELKEVRQEAEFIKSVTAYTAEPAPEAPRPIPPKASRPIPRIMPEAPPPIPHDEAPRPPRPIPSIMPEAPPPIVQEVPTATLAAPCVEIESKLQSALDFLRDDARKMLGVWGMGGVGKTTLLKHINAKVLDASFGFDFDRVVLVTASRVGTIGKIQMSFMKELGLSGGDHFAKIYNYLSNKSFLLLVDDLWECLDIQEMGIPLPLGVIEGHKRKMILASRSQQVLHGMGVHRSVRVECLSHEAAWFLFRENVGAEAITSHPRILELANQVADQCGGLPQHLITIGRAMAENRSIVSWERAVEDLRESVSNFSGRYDHTVTGHLPLLKVSYDYLKNERKQQCLLHCALWPEDYKIREDELIQCWMGHGLLGEINNLQEAYRKGHATIESLRNAGLLEHAESDYDDIKGNVKLHDLIREMALWIACDCGANMNKWVVLAGQRLQEAPRDQKLWGEAHKISLMFNQIKSLPSEIHNSPNLTTLMLQENDFCDGGLRMSKYFNSLKYLDISGCSSLKCFPIEICGLTKLEYLNISNTAIRSLPQELKALVNMKYLIARELSMINSRVPSELLRNLLNLIELDLFCSGNEVFTTSIIDNLDCLERCLKGLGISVTTISNLQKLIGLSGIPISSLYLEGMEGLDSSLELLSHNFLGSQHIQSNLKVLALSCCESVEEVVVEGNHQLEIERLLLDTTTRLKEIKWRGVEPRGVLPKLRQLYVRNCYALKSIEWVMYLPCLELLGLEGCSEMEQLFGEEAGVAGTKQKEEDKPTFPSLRSLTLYNLPKLSSICHRPLTFPSLEVLTILRCEQLKMLPFDSPLSCPKLREIHCDEATWNGIGLEDNMQAILMPLLDKIK